MNHLTALLSDPHFLKLVPCQKISYSADSVILKEDEEGQELFLITKGRVEVSSTPMDDVNGIPVKLAILEVGDIFGELSMFDCGPRSAHVTALTDCEVFRVNGPKLISYLDEHPDSGYFVIRELFMHLVLHIRQNNMRTRMAVQMYFQEHQDDEAQ